MYLISEPELPAGEPRILLPALPSSSGWLGHLEPCEADDPRQESKESYSLTCLLPGSLCPVFTCTLKVSPWSRQVRSLCRGPRPCFVCFLFSLGLVRCSMTLMLFLPTCSKHPRNFKWSIWCRKPALQSEEEEKEMSVSTDIRMKPISGAGVGSQSLRSSSYK